MDEIKMKEVKERCADYSTEMTNEEYRIELQKIFESITDNKKLRFYYKYMCGMEKSSD